MEIVRPDQTFISEWLKPLNITLAEVGRRLAAGQAVKIHVEPGDATRYEFFLLPMSNEQLRVTGTDDSMVAISIISPYGYGSYFVRMPQTARDIDHTASYFLEHILPKKPLSSDLYGTMFHTCRVIVSVLWAIATVEQDV